MNTNSLFPTLPAGSVNPTILYPLKSNHCLGFSLLLLLLLVPTNVVKLAFPIVKEIVNNKFYFSFTTLHFLSSLIYKPLGTQGCIFLHTNDELSVLYETLVVKVEKANQDDFFTLWDRLNRLIGGNGS